MVTILEGHGRQGRGASRDLRRARRRVRAKELVVAASIGTAGIMNRCQKLVCVDEKNAVAADPPRRHRASPLRQAGRGQGLLLGHL
ncbi:MAG: hypothetical protein M0C28_27380 [Candidatus Moduliflexus flocculans]|nr:hypothetical protein [Candidatus Moduliflexus flocculans]